MRICLLAAASSIHTKRWVDYLCAQGHEVSIISFAAGDLAPAQTFHLDVGPIHPEGGNWRYLLKLPDVYGLLRALNPDLFNAHFLTSYGLIAALLKRRGIPLVTHLYGSDILRAPQRSPLYRLAARYALRRADLLISLAAHMTERTRALAGPEVKILTLSWGVDLALFHALQPAAQGRSNGVARCICHRAWVRNSNMMLILHAARLARQELPGLEVMLVGGGPEEGALRSAIADLQLKGTVSLQGRVPEERIAQLLREHDLYLSATRSDGASSALLEAMACGTFPIVTDIPANREWITHGDNGFLVSLEDPVDMAKRIVQAANDTSLRAQAQRRNAQIVQERASRARNMSEMERRMAVLLEAVH